MTIKLDCLEIEPTTPATASVIWLHGLGASANDFISLVPALNLPYNHGIRFIFPNAPQRPITLNGGYIMPGWFDIYDIHPKAKQDKEGIEEINLAITDLIKKENQQGIPTDKIIIAGFSQGGAIALHTALHYPEKLAGVMGLSTFLPLHENFGERNTKVNANTPIFLAHGNNDQVVPLAFGEMTKQLLELHHYAVDWHTYPMEHNVCPKEVFDISTWLQQQLFLRK